MPDNNVPPPLDDITTFSLQAYSVFCELKYISFNDPFNQLFLTEEDLAAKTRISLPIVHNIINALVKVGWATFDNPEKTDISCTKLGHTITNMGLFSSKFPMNVSK